MVKAAGRFLGSPQLEGSRDRKFPRLEESALKSVVMQKNANTVTCGHLCVCLVSHLKRLAGTFQEKKNRNLSDKRQKRERKRENRAGYASRAGPV